MPEDTRLPELVIRRMSPEDLPEVMELERRAFSAPWTEEMYRREMEKWEGCYLVARSGGELAGYGGALLILDEAHVMTLAVREDLRRRGIGARLLLELVRRAERMGARFLTLEVRKSNRPAIELYTRFGFQVMGERRQYYLDNLEDALIMWTEDITSPEYRKRLEELERRYGAV
ncbi:ribosomal protein S18-alanine N-acetyltransferase [Candidatus Solincola tengchongensis]|uniref:ribosomal protein S18-alanine N-acetyltransferase n=1 Tax=Candidatus Solincola tengchongensis TaxID=2900693 RepID=UPI0025799C48|nr:ribosomal protein S18-alanine N-acetyltransferase [Candidatus Solincola tengchongensis]